MKRILVAVALAVGLAGSAFAGDDDITAPIITNVFTTAISQSSSSLRSVRVGINSTTARAAVILNQAGYAPVVLSNTDGHLTYNGVALTTDTFAGTDMSVTQDLTVGRDAAITRNETVGGTLGVTGALTGTSGSFSTTLGVTGNVTLGAAGYKSTMTASNGNWAMSGDLAVAGALSGPTSITGTKLVASGVGSVGLYSRTKAQILALTPAAAGQAYYCSDCTAVTVCVSTGTGAGAFTKVTDRAAACD